MNADFFMDRRLQASLRNALATVPALVEDMAITITRQARIQRNGRGGRRTKPGSRLPFHLAAADAADELHNTLVTWTRFVCEGRHIHYTGHDDDLSLSQWLSRNITELALCEGSEEACADICARIDECRRIIDLPPEDEIVIDRQRVKEANRQIVTAGQVEKIAGKLGEMGKGLTADRIRTLTRGKHLQPVSVDPDTQTKFYRLGDVLHAHTSCATRSHR